MTPTTEFSKLDPSTDIRSNLDDEFAQDFKNCIVENGGRDLGPKLLIKALTNLGIRTKNENLLSKMKDVQTFCQDVVESKSLKESYSSRTTGDTVGLKMT